jgi:hypothetical protein
VRRACLTHALDETVLDEQQHGELRARVQLVRPELLLVRVHLSRHQYSPRARQTGSDAPQTWT